MVDMLHQCAPASIDHVIDVLRKAKEKYGDIPIAGFNGNGFHISVERSDRDLNDLSTLFSFSEIYPRPKGQGTHYIRKEKPDTKFIWFWD